MLTNYYNITFATLCYVTVENKNHLRTSLPRYILLYSSLYKLYLSNINFKKIGVDGFSLALLKSPIPNEYNIGFFLFFSLYLVKIKSQNKPLLYFWYALVLLKWIYGDVDFSLFFDYYYLFILMVRLQ
jgi:hypothetical protein